MSAPDAAPERFDAGWLALREPADAAARSAALARTAGHAAGHAAGAAPRPLVVHDLGCGSGAMARWLAPRLPGPQHWVLHDRDPDLLRRAAAGAPPHAADGAAVTVTTRRGDLTALTPADLAGAGLVTASALLDLLTAAEVTALAGTLAATGAPALLTLSVRGRVDLDPADPLDAQVGAAFDDHQRRTVGGRRLLGPDAPRVAAAALRRHGLRVVTRPSGWRLGPDRAALTRAWLLGWAGAAAEQAPDLPVGPYLARRLADLDGGRLAVRVHHTDLLALTP